jgi:hypothetical protein
MGIVGGLPKCALGENIFDYLKNPTPKLNV